SSSAQKILSQHHGVQNYGATSSSGASAQHDKEKREKSFLSMFKNTPTFTVRETFIIIFLSIYILGDYFIGRPEIFRVFFDERFLWRYPVDFYQFSQNYHK